VAVVLNEIIINMNGYFLIVGISY